MSKLKQIWDEVIKKYWLRRYNFKKGFKEFLKEHDDSVIPWTIYGENLNIKEFAKDFDKLNKNWKNRLLVPCVKLAKILVPPRMISRKPNTENPYYKNLVAFDRAYTQSVDDWIKYFIIYTNMSLKSKENRNAEIKKYYEKGTAHILLKNMWEMARTMIANDTAYLEFFNILMYNTYKEMQKIYKDKGEINHLLYNSKRIEDIKYYILANQMNSDNTLILNITDNGEATKNQ
jgi:hypothetical protein